MFRCLFSVCGVNRRAHSTHVRHNSPTPQPSLPTPGVVGSPHLLMQDLRSTSSTANPPHTGFLAGADHTDLRHAILTDIAGDLNININMQDHELSLLDKLPYAKDAGYKSGNRDMCLEGTREAELQRIQDWEADHMDMLVYWLNGIAGSGKTTIAQTFAVRSAAKGRLGASFFCSSAVPDRRNINCIFPTLAYQLAFRYPEFKDALILIITSNPNVGYESLADQLEYLLVQPLKATGISTTIVIDALDECEDNNRASKILSHLAGRIQEIPSVKFFFTGRPEPPIRSVFRREPLKPLTEVFRLHEVEPASVDKDIERYLRTHLSEIVAERSDSNLTAPAWPSDKDVIVATKKCSGLFIVAFVIVKIVSASHREPRERLEVLINQLDSTVYEGKSGVDRIYHQVFLSYGDEDDAKFFAWLRLVLSSIVLSFNPLSCASIATVLKMSTESIRTALRLLHSVLVIPDSDSEVIRICHKSLADYLTDVERCTDGRFYIEPALHHLELGTRCLELMNTVLKQNLCGLPQFAMNSDINDLHARRKRYIGDGLEYACRSWAKHICLAPMDANNVGNVVESLKCFLQHNLLSWLEVLSIVGDLRCAVYSLNDVKAWLINAGFPDTTLESIVKDSERFVVRFFDVITVSAPHIYHSALPLSPESSLVRALYRDDISNDVKMNTTDASWDACIRTIPTVQSGNCAVFSHMGDLIAVGVVGRVRIFEATTGQHRAALPRQEYARSLAFSPDDAFLVTGGEGGAVSFWDLQTGSLVDALKEHTGPINSVAFSPSGTMIASCSNDHTIRIWDVSPLRCRCVLVGHSDRVHSICWSGAGREVVSGSSDDTVKVWDVFEIKCLKTFSGHKSTVRSVASSPDSSLIASGFGDGRVQILDYQTGAIVHTVLTKGCVLSIRFLTGDQIMYTTDRGLFVIWDLNRAADSLRFTYEGFSATFSFNGAYVISLGHGVMYIWQTDGTANAQMAGSHSRGVTSVCFSEDGQLIASGSKDRTVKIWDSTTGLCLWTSPPHSDSVSSVVFSSDATFFAAGADDYSIRIWDVRTRATVVTIQGCFALCMGFSPSGHQLVTLQSDVPTNEYAVIELWDVATGEYLAETKVERQEPGHESHCNVEFRRDDEISMKNDGRIYNWKITPAPDSDDDKSSIDDDEMNSSTLPMMLIPQYHNDEQPERIVPRPVIRNINGWILDEQDRRIFWLPPALTRPKSGRSRYGKRVALGTEDGRVVIMDFSDCT